MRTIFRANCPCTVRNQPQNHVAIVRPIAGPRSVHMAGEIGIRTHDGLSSPVLETGTLDRYATLLYDGA